MNRENREINEPELSACVRRVMKQYFKDLDGERPAPVYEMVVASVEKPLLEVVLQQAEGNQTRAAEMLGINRNTLRKKMNDHGIE
ncbi:MAG: Fis family transcriptional regulator [Burkholderiales bacterium]|nr:Fis family transcriptional regulator [Burkholderiales bacterium]